jgi:hypothetical protein
MDTIAAHEASPNPTKGPSQSPSTLSYLLTLVFAAPLALEVCCCNDNNSEGTFNDVFRHRRVDGVVALSATMTGHIDVRHAVP